MGTNRLNMTEEEKKERKKAQQKKYKEKNKDRLKAYQKEYAEKNKDRIKASQKAWRDANKDRIKEKNKNYNDAHRVIDRYFYFEHEAELNTMMIKFKETGAFIEEIRSDMAVTNPGKFRHNFMLHVTWIGKTTNQIYEENDIFEYYGISSSMLRANKLIDIEHKLYESTNVMKPLIEPATETIKARTFGTIFKDNVKDLSDNNTYTIKMRGKDLKQLPDIFNTQATDTKHKITLVDDSTIRISGMYDDSRKKLLETMETFGISKYDLDDMMPQINALAEKMANNVKVVTNEVSAE